MPPQEPTSSATSAYTSSGAQSGQTDSASSTGMEQKIKHALTKHGVTASGVNVAFNNGTATLSGTVFTHSDIAKAKRAAMHVRGVTQVDVSDLHARKSKGSQSQS